MNAAASFNLIQSLKLGICFLFPINEIHNKMPPNSTN